VEGVRLGLHVGNFEGMDEEGRSVLLIVGEVLGCVVGLGADLVTVEGV